MHRADRPLDAAEPHVAAHANLVAVAKASIDRVATFGRERGWRNIRLLSSGGNSFSTTTAKLTANRCR